MEAPGIDSKQLRYYPRDPAVLATNYAELFENMSPARGAGVRGIAGLVLYLDELILWLSHRASQQEWFHAEVQKMVKLVESQEASRAVPIVSFIARQRNLAEMVGKMHTGLEQQLLFDSLKHWEGRFDQIVLEDRDLAPIVEKRVLKTKTGDRSEIDRAFEKLRATAGKSFETLQGSEDLVRFSETHVLKHEESRLQPLENKRLQKGAERPTVGELRAWIDEGHKMGLQSEPLDMVVRCYAIWARRTLELDGRPLDASVHKGELPERTVLEKPELPTQQDWSAALTKAGHCFGVTFAGKHLSPDNLGRFRGELDAKVELAAAPCAVLTGLIEQRAAELAVGTDIDRITTARSAEQAVMAVRGKTGVEQVRALAAFEPSTSGPAVGRHVGRAAELTTVLQDELVFGAFRQLAQQSAELVGAEELLDEARASFRQDEVIVQLAPRLRELAKRAQSLLTRPAPVAAPESTLVTVKGNAVGKAAVRARLSAMVDELSAALERAER